MVVKYYSDSPCISVSQVPSCPCAMIFMKSGKVWSLVCLVNLAISECSWGLFGLQRGLGVLAQAGPSDQ